MAAPALPWLFLLAGILPAGHGSGRAGEMPPARAMTGRITPAVAPNRPGLYQVSPRAVLYADTVKKPVSVSDTVKTRSVVVLEPEPTEKVTRKSALYIVAAIAVLTLTTLLLYNVRSR